MTIPDISVVIPAYNEAEAIFGVVSEIEDILEKNSLLFEIIVVDDGSADGTSEALSGSKAKVIRHP